VPEAAASFSARTSATSAWSSPPPSRASSRRRRGIRRSHPERAKERRNTGCTRWLKPLHPAGGRRARVARAGGARARALESEAPHFVDYLTQEAPGAEQGGGRRGRLLDARPAPPAHRAGCRPEGLNARRRDPRQAQAALPAGGTDRDRSPHRRILAMVGGGPTTSRSTIARSARNASPLGLQALRLSGRVRTGRSRRAHRHHAGDRRRRRTDDVHVRGPGMEPEQLRQRVRRPDHAAACARPLRNVATIKVAESTGSTTSRPSAKSDSARHPRGIPRSRSAFRSDAVRDRHAYTVFPNGGTIRPLRAINRIVGAGKDLRSTRMA